MAGFSKMFATEVLTFGPPIETSSNVYNLDVWDHNQLCNAWPQLPSHYIPINTELLGGIPIVCGADNPNNPEQAKSYCHKLVKGVWMSVPTPPTSANIIGAATSTLALKSMSTTFITPRDCNIT